jgi:hypothetical protein
MQRLATIHIYGEKEKFCRSKAADPARFDCLCRWMPLPLVAPFNLLVRSALQHRVRSAVFADVTLVSS